MTRYEFWRECETGELWAVRLDDGGPVGARGPLHWSEVSPMHMGMYDYASEEASVLAAREDEFERLDRGEVVVLAGSAD